MSGSAGPVVSVIIPTWRRSEVVCRAVDSVLAQSGVDLEVIVVNDGGDEATKQLVAGMSDYRLRLVEQGHQGVSAARNRGAREARGALLTFLDSDDEALPGWLRSLTDAFDDPSVAVACCGMWVQSEDGREAVTPTPRGAELGGFTSLFQAGSFAVRASLFHHVGGYWEELTHSENTELGFRLTAHCRREDLRIAVISEPLFIYHRDTPKPESRERVRELLANSERLLERHLETLAANPSSLASILSTAGRRAALLDDLPRARRYFARAVRADPRKGRAYARLLVSAVPPLARWVWSPDSDQEAVPC